MAVTQNSFTGNGSTTTYSFTFPYLKQTEIKASLDGTATTAFTTPTATTVQFNTAPGSGVKIKIFRETDSDSLAATFYAGSAIKSEDLNDNFTQNLYATQEVAARYLSNLGGTMTGDLNLGEDVVVKFEGASDNAHETTLTVVDPTADRTITLPNVTGTVITTGDTGTVTSAIIADGTIVSGDIADGTIVNADINASAAIAGTKISPDFGSQNVSTTGTLAAGVTTVTGNIVVSGTVDGRDVATDGTKLDGIETAATADQTNAEIRAAVEAATDSNVFTDADHSKLNAIEASATADQTDAEIRAAVEAASDSNVFTDADHTKLNGIETAATADQTASEIKTLIASSPLDASHLAANSVTTSEIADAELTTLAGMQTGTASILADSTALTATTTELNILDNKSFRASGDGALTTTSDTEIPSSKVVANHVAAQLGTVGGFTTIATEVAFPATASQPASGVIISISDAAGVVVNGSGVSTTGRTTDGTPATVTINSFPSSLNGETLASGVGLLVTSTGSGNTYTYHKLLAAETDVKQLSDDINDFNARYRVAGSAPGSNNDAGDMYFDTSANKMKVYNGTTNAWDDVASVGNFYINTISSSSGTGGGSATFNGSAYRFTLSNPPTMAQQLIVSVNGVLQKPDAGSSQPSEGFAISGNDILFSAAPASGSDYFIVTQGSSVSIGTPSDNTVSTAKLQNLGVTTAKIAADAVDGTKIADDAVGAEHIEVLDANLQFGDNAKIQIGTGNDLNIYHTGSTSIIEDTTSDLNLRSTNDDVIIQAADDIFLRPQGGEEGVIIRNNGAVQLYYDNAKKIETSSDGITVSGDVTVDNGTSSKLSINSSTHNASVANEAKLELGFAHSGNPNAIGYVKLNESGNNAFDGKLTVGVPYNGGSGGSATRDALFIRYNGAIGVTGENYGSSGQVLTSGGGSAAPSWTTISSSPQVTGTASGAITAGKAVIVNSSGQLTKVTESATAVNPPTLDDAVKQVVENIPRTTDNVGAPSTFDGDTVQAYDPVDKVLCSMYVYNNINYIIPGVMTSNNEEIMWANGAAGQISISSGREMKAIVNTGEGTFLAFYRINNKPYARVFKQTGTAADRNNIALAWQTSEVLIPSGLSNDQTDYESNAYHLGSGKVLYIWYNAQAVSIYYSIMGVSSSGTGTVVTRLNPGVEIDTDGGFYNRTLVHSSGKIICLFQHRTPGGSEQGYPQYRVGTVDDSNNTVSWASRVTLTSNSVSWNNSANLVELKDGRILAVYNYSSTTYYRIGTLSGTSISWTSETSISGVTGGNVAVDENSGILAWSYKDQDDCKLRSGTISSNAISLGSAVTYGDMDLGSGDVYTRFESAAKLLYLSTSKTFSWLGRQRKQNGNERQVVQTLAKVGTTTTDLTATNFVGLANASYTNGQTATVDVMGGTNSSVSGLTAGTEYYVQNDGSLATGTGDYNQLAGLALSSTKLLIKG